ncbi:hypothetical protein O0S10_02985 [Methanocorpusculum sp. MG]|uniref:Archaeal Type IV pilin N-terminal domain-containing protein n=1 Tax=Methanocorpusculum petauri TaxID=3002863 RepID=A0ABT4IEN0_9EURY|nr:type IV pilin [Methanocorpusculum petauri]MCZ0860195.1 hypothetical protein [Methanocorpusculum petauri]
MRSYGILLGIFSGCCHNEEKRREEKRREEKRREEKRREEKRRDDAVSSTIATILLVAIVVVVAALVVMVTSGMAGGGNDPKSVGLKVTSDHTDVLVTFFTGRDVSSLQALRVSVAGNPYVTEAESTDTTAAVRHVGVPIRFAHVGMPGTHTTTVTGIFPDDTAVVIWTGKLDFEPWPVDVNSVWNGQWYEGEYRISVTLPNGWDAENVHGELLPDEIVIVSQDGIHRYKYTWGKQLVVSVYDPSNNEQIVSRTYYPSEIVDMINLGKNSLEIAHDDNNQPFNSGTTYRVKVQEMVVDCTSGSPVNASSITLYNGPVLITGS